MSSVIFDDIEQYQNVCAVTGEGGLFCWGNNTFGQLGNGKRDPSFFRYAAPTRVLLGERAVERVSLGGRHSCAVTDDKQLYCWGYNASGQLGVACGPELVCSTNDTIFDILYYGSPNKVPVDGVDDVYAGFGFSCALTQDGNILCWGVNSFGQLGINKTAEEVPSTATPTPVVWKLGASPSPFGLVRGDPRVATGEGDRQGPSRFARSTTVPGLAAVAASKAAKPTK